MRKSEAPSLRSHSFVGENRVCLVRILLILSTMRLEPGSLTSLVFQRLLKVLREAWYLEETTLNWMLTILLLQERESELAMK
ncbi:hypothetical protein SLEP1_g1165 [Rubroshorea leprosula]|uniref:Uncharacterized protein n=1 Tax=Rubroshorea leprosula TaxID=152421 RepID=A0AAV5HK25_9ROSI|nr:hypothetical protein SLEP1_g1165 [Rubroshorea leprosula]